MVEKYKSIAFMVLIMSLMTKSALAQFENPFQLDNGRRNFKTWQGKSPKEAAAAIGNMLVQKVKFAHSLSIEKHDEKFESPEILNFGRALCPNKNAIAFATTDLIAPEDTTISMSLRHTGEVIVWLDKKEIYRSVTSGSGDLNLSLKRGENRLLIKYLSTNNDWKITLDPNGARNLTMGIKKFVGIDPSVSSLSKWLITEPYEADNSGINTTCGAESGYDGVGGPIVWTIPKVEPVWRVVNKGQFTEDLATYGPYSSALAWTMGRLGKLPDGQAFDHFFKLYCASVMDAKNWIQHEVSELGRPMSAHHKMMEKNLEGRVASALPFAALWQNSGDRIWVHEAIPFLEKEVCKQNDGAYCREKPLEGYYLVAEDIFMAIPFLVELARTTTDPSLKKKYLDMASRQVIALSNATFDPKENLYHQAVETNRPSNYPYVSRSNGLALFAISLLLEQLPKNHPDYKAVLKLYQQHTAKLVALQNPKTGQWPRLLTDTTSATETSGNGLITASIAKGINNGWLPKSKFEKVADLGWKGICSYISPEADVFGICLPLELSEDVNYFKKRLQVRNSSEGLFPVLWAAMEVEKMQAKK